MQYSYRLVFLQLKKTTKSRVTVNIIVVQYLRMLFKNVHKTTESITPTVSSLCGDEEDRLLNARNAKSAVSEA